MLLNIFYSIFFVVVNWLIYLKLQKSYQYPKAHLYLGIIIIVLIFHLGLINNDFLMNPDDFFNILFLSVGLIILHFATNIQVELFKKYNNTQNEKSDKLQSKFLIIFDFMRQKLIYIMATISQILDIWIKDFR